MLSTGGVVASFIVLTVLLAAGVACNVVAVVTNYWVVASVSALGDIVSANYNFGIWTSCVSSSVPGVDSQCVTTDDNIVKKSVLISSRVLSIAAPCSCVIVTYMLVIGAHALRSGIAFLPTVISVVFLQIGCSAAALLPFFFELKANIDPVFAEVMTITPGLIDTSVLPGWSFYVGCGGVVCYIVALLWLITAGVFVCASPRENDEVVRHYSKPI